MIRDNGKGQVSKMTLQQVTQGLGYKSVNIANWRPRNIPTGPEIWTHIQGSGDVGQRSAQWPCCKADRCSFTHLPTSPGYILWCHLQEKAVCGLWSWERWGGVSLSWRKNLFYKAISLSSLCVLGLVRDGKIFQCFLLPKNKQTNKAPPALSKKRTNWKMDHQ